MDNDVEDREKGFILFLLDEITYALNTLNVQVMIISNLTESQEAFQCKLLSAVNEESIALRKLQCQQKKYVIMFFVFV